MSRTFGGRAIAAAAMVLAILAGAQGTSARAEALPALAQPAPVAAIAPLAAGFPVFVQQEVVQPLPQAAGAGSLAGLVDAITVEGEMSPEMRCLAGAVYFEARGEPLEGQLAVANVVINRANSGLYPANYCGVVTQRAQFSFVRNGAIPSPDESSAAWHRAQAIAQIAAQDLWDCEAGDALFFHASYVRPGWAQRKTRLARIDTHIFYR